MLKNDQKRPMINILESTLAQVAREMERKYGKGEFHANALFREIYKKGNRDFLTAREFENSPRLASALEGQVELEPEIIENSFGDGDLTKFITRLSDGLKIESVIIPMTRHNTLCISSQVGCRMGCAFCETGSMGFKRNLGVSEIVGQVYNARHTLGVDIKNIVFMGMGEPFDNFDNVMDAVRIMNQQKGFDIALRHITLSTAGLVPGINRLAKMDMPGIRLAVSVNGADDVTRSRIMPVNRRYPLAELKKSLASYPLPKRGVFLFEYILIQGVNDSEEHAEQLADFIHPLPVRLNLIPYNRVSGFDHQSPSDGGMHEFAEQMYKRGVFVIKRWSKGRSVSAGCGQLGRDAGNLGFH